MKRAALDEIPFLPPASGLCETCMYQQDCSLRSVLEPSVMFCEEFSPEETKRRPALAAVGFPSPAAPEPVELIGLCKNCANRAHCTLRKPVGGVWHCEEFA